MNIILGMVMRYILLSALRKVTTYIIYIKALLYNMVKRYI